MTSDVIEATAVVVREPDVPTLFGTANPREHIERAKETADALKDVIKQRGLISKIQGKEYVLYDGWTLLGSMVGVSPVNVWTRKLEDGWEARVEVHRNGVVIGAAEAECLRSETSWKSRDDYALRSMAQTRAGAKALRTCLGFIVQLAGYEATPHDEMPERGDTIEGGRSKGPPAITDKQANYLAKLMRQLHDVAGAEASGFYAMLAESYPSAASDKGKLIIKNLNVAEAGEIIDLVQKTIRTYQEGAEQTGEKVDYGDLPNE